MGKLPERRPPKPAEGALVPLRRVWLVDPTGRYLIQLDPPRFLHNWRKREDRDPYPRFETAYSRFTESLKLYQAFAEESSLGDLNPNLYELSYINHIFEEEDVFPEQVGRFLNFYGWQPSSAFQGHPEALNIRLALPLPNKAGRLTVSVQHGTRETDGKSVLVLDLTARGATKMTMDEWFSIAHETIVRGFAEVTTDEAQRLWRRKR